MRTIDLGPMAPKVAVAAARYGMSGTTFIRAAVSAALDELADRDPDLARVFASMDREGAVRPSVPGIPVPA
jgi:hypothetical protein